MNSPTRLLLIGNYARGKEVFDGQHLKVRLYYDILKREKFDVNLIDLNDVKRNPLKVFRAISKGIKRCDVIVLLTAGRGARILIPYINFLNRKQKKRFVLPLIGTSVLHAYLDKMSAERKLSFIQDKNFAGCSPKNFLARNLAKIDAILPETPLITEAFRDFFSLRNVYTLPNFRLPSEVKSEMRNGLVFISRVTKNKGIFVLMDAFAKAKVELPNLTLDIYGPLQLTPDEQQLFLETTKNVDGLEYKGVLNSADVSSVLRHYDCLVFPTLYLTEGMPGILAEALMASTAVISSDFPQASAMLKEGQDSLFFKLGDSDSLAETIISFYKQEGLKDSLLKGAAASGKQYLYSTHREAFLNLIKGDHL